MLCQSNPPCQNDTPCQSDVPCHFVTVPNRHIVSFCRCGKVTLRAKVTHRVDLTTVSFCRCVILTRSQQNNLSTSLYVFFDLQEKCDSKNSTNIFSSYLISSIVTVIKLVDSKSFNFKLHTSGLKVY